MKTLRDVGEFGWLKRLVPNLYWPSSLNSQLCISAGDDAGALRLTPGKVLVATTDAMVEGIHFDRKWFSWESLGEKILVVNLSDLAAMGDVKPLAALITAAFPMNTPVRAVEKFYKGLKSCAQRWKTGLLGGDTVGSKRDWFISVTVFGEAKSQNLVKRSGARLGDYLVTTGPLGLAGAGLEVLQAGKSSLRWTDPLVDAFTRPQPRFKAGGILGRHHLATSLMDCSDGLEASARILSEASGVGAVIDWPSLPIHPALARWAKMRKRAPREYARIGGEDYELISTVRPSDWPRVKSLISGATRIGWIVPRGKGQNLKSYGYSHF